MDPGSTAMLPSSPGLPRSSVSRCTPSERATQRRTQAYPRYNVTHTYLGDSFLVARDSLKDERVDFNIPVPAGDHDPGPTEAHGHFHTEVPPGGASSNPGGRTNSSTDGSRVSARMNLGSRSL